MKKRLMDYIPNSDEGIDEIGNGELYPGEFDQRCDDAIEEDTEEDEEFMNKPVDENFLKGVKDYCANDAMTTKEICQDLLHKKELRDRFDAMTGDERDILISRFGTRELYSELGRRLDKAEKFIEDLDSLVSSYRRKDD